ncbi:MAG: hypothetical protein ACP5KG_11935, partial [Myxococcota bacterium]
LEDYSGTDVGKILVSVNPHWSPNSYGGEEGIKENRTSILDQFTLAIKKGLEKLGLLIEDGIASVKEIVTEKLLTKEIETESIFAKNAKLGKVEMIDQSTGEVYCIWIENGDFKKVKGECK